MRLFTLLKIGLVCVLLSACGTVASSDSSADGPSTTLGTLQISGVWARATEGMSDSDAVGVAYMTIRNTGGAPDRLLNVQGDVARSVELHTMASNNNVMEMRPVPSVDVPSNGEVALKPGGTHIMFIGLKRDLHAGDKVDLKLTFEKAGAVNVQADVRP